MDFRACRIKDYNQEESGIILLKIPFEWLPFERINASICEFYV